MATQASEYEVVIIGSGPGGEGAAMQAAKDGRSVVVVERYARVGGGCTHWGTIPSKALRHAIQEYTNFRHNPLLADAVRRVQLGYPQMMADTAAVIARQVDMRQSFYERNRVAILHGQAVFRGPHELDVLHDDGPAERLRARHFVVATGSRPYHPPDVDFSHPRVLDADTVLRMDFTPQSMAIYGAGVVGCEYASMFRNLGMKVNLVNVRERLLSFLDDEITDALAYHLREQGVLIRNAEEYEKVEPADDGVTLRLKSGKVIKTDVLLWANGRTGNSDGMGLEALGIVPDSRGNLPVNESLQTKLPHVYAVGDVVGPPALASSAYDQGRFAARHMADPATGRSLLEYMPTGIYTSPEISCIGRNEKELTAAKVPYEVGHSMFRSLARAQITGQLAGMLKILFHRETREVLGIHCFGYQAAEIVHIGQSIMARGKAGNTLDYFVNATFNYPTMAEAYRVAALNGLNRLR